MMLVEIDVSEYSGPLVVSNLGLGHGQYIRLSNESILIWEQDYRKCRHKLPTHNLSNYSNIAYPNHTGVRVNDYSFDNVGNEFEDK